jgi:hypothetical protein
LILTHQIALDISGLVASLEVRAMQEPFTTTPKIMPSNAKIFGSLNPIEASYLSNLTNTTYYQYTRFATKEGII